VTENEIAQAYIQLALAVDQHKPGFVDAYYGPSGWQRQAQVVGPRPLAELVREGADLLTAIADAQMMDPQRREYLTQEIWAVNANLRLLQGEKLSLVDEAKLLYDLSPTWINESVFEEIHHTLDSLLPPGESLDERMEAKKRETLVPAEKLEPLLLEIAAELRRRTRDRFPLPVEESIELQFVKGKPWSAYNAYLGNCYSRIEISLDFPHHLPFLADLIAHEGYPGHHTEQVNKEVKLRGEKGWLEHSMALLNSPASVVSEGIATRALPVLLADDEWIAWHQEVLFPLAGLSQLEAHREYELMQAKSKLMAVSGNAAILWHDGGASETEVIAYIKRYRLATDEEAQKNFNFLNDPLLRSYVFTYHLGGELLDTLFATQSERDTWFRRLLTEPITPGQIRAWITDITG
jgi:hypothetical protein